MTHGCRPGTLHIVVKINELLVWQQETLEVCVIECDKQHCSAAYVTSACVCVDYPRTFVRPATPRRFRHTVRLYIQHKHRHGSMLSSPNMAKKCQHMFIGAQIAPNTQVFSSESSSEKHVFFHDLLFKHHFALFA